MGDIVLYDHLGQNPERVWVPRAELRFWLRFWRRNGRIALSLNQWKRQGYRPFRPLKKPRTVSDRIAEATESASRVMSPKR